MKTAISPQLTQRSSFNQYLFQFRRSEDSIFNISCLLNQNANIAMKTTTIYAVTKEESVVITL